LCHGFGEHFRDAAGEALGLAGSSASARPLVGADHRAATLFEGGAMAIDGTSPLAF